MSVVFNSPNDLIVVVAENPVGPPSFGNIAHPISDHLAKFRRSGLIICKTMQIHKKNDLILISHFTKFYEIEIKWEVHTAPVEFHCVQNIRISFADRENMLLIRLPIAEQQF